jgi:hypothetical protein
MDRKRENMKKHVLRGILGAPYFLHETQYGIYEAQDPASLGTHRNSFCSSVALLSYPCDRLFHCD